MGARVVCEECGWVRDYSTRYHATVGYRRHAERACPNRDHVLGAADRKWRTRAEAAGYRTERSVEEWLAHPFALDDLARVVYGESLHVIDADRRKWTDLHDGAED